MSLPINSLYSLTWGDYGTSLVSAIQLLRCHGDLVDCTLAAGGRSFPAHKIVLCAASPFLFELLKNTPCKHPVVMLAGVNANDLEALLEFVYRGEVSVDHSQLPSLLQAAHCLNIQGLAPQTVTKDDYTTQIQLHPIMQQHHVKTVIDDQEQLIATIAAPQPHTVHAQVVDDMGSGTITAHVQDVKDVINQFLPSRKRKPRAKRPQVSKVARSEGLEGNTLSAENGEGPITSTPIKHGTSRNEVILSDVSVTPNASNTSAVGSSTKSGSTMKPRSRSQSEQPATCPICFAIIRQSRNLRRHLELRHFAKQGIKKDRKAPTQKKSSTTGATLTVNSNSTTATNNTGPTVQSVQTLHTLQNVQVKKEPETICNVSTSGTPVSVTVGGTQSQQQVQTQSQQQGHQQTTAIIDQTGTITTTASGNGQQLGTQTENSDGTTSLSIAHVQTLQGHQLTLGNLNQATIIRNDDLETAHDSSIRSQTNIYHLGTVYTIEEHEEDSK